jgi:hypothetical protein
LGKYPKVTNPTGSGWSLIEAMRESISVESPDVISIISNASKRIEFFCSSRRRNCFTARKIIVLEGCAELAGASKIQAVTLRVPLFESNTKFNRPGPEARVVS